MAPNREERFLMRQRGAGTRQIQDFDFGLVLPGVAPQPLKPQRLGRSRRTPQPELLPRRSSRAPASTRKLLPQRSSQRTPATAREQPPAKSTLPAGLDEIQGGPLSLGATGVDGDGTVRKRRRLNYIGEALVENEVSPDRDINTQVATSTPTVPKDSVEEHVEGIRVKRRKKRKSIGQTSRKRTKPRVSEALPEDSAIKQEEGAVESLHYAQPRDEAAPEAQERVHQDPIQRKRKSPVQESKKRTKQIRVTDISEAHDTNPLAVEAEAQTVPKAPSVAPAKPKIRRKKRKSIGAISKKRIAGRPQEAASINVSASIVNTGTESRMEPDARPMNPMERPSTSSAENDNVEVLVGGKEVLNDTSRPSERRKRGRPRKATIPEPASAGTQSKSVLPKPPPSKPQRETAPSINVEKSTTKEVRATRSRRKDQDSVPITIQHLSHSQALSVDDEYDDDPLNTITFPKKIGVNAVDVLSQICKELVEKTAETLAQGAANKTSEKRRSECKRKARNVEIFGDELDDRLFHMAEALDNKAALTTRLRKATKENKMLKDELLKLRQNREAVALQTNKIKIHCEKPTKAAQTEEDLSRMLHDIERAVKRGQALQRSQKGSAELEKPGQESLELLLRTVATDVSSARGPGLLKQVKEFNKLLERAVAVG